MDAVLQKTRVLLDYAACYDAFIELCQEACETVYIGAWFIDFDWRMNGKRTVRELIEEMCARGVQVRILLTPNVIYAASLPQGLPDGCTVHYARTRGPRFRYFERRVVRKTAAALVPDYDYRLFSTHHKYLVADGRRALLGCIDVSEERNGSEVTGQTNSEGYVWSDTGVLTECDDALWRYCEDNFETRGEGEVDALPWVGPFPTQSHEARLLVSMVEQSKRLLYIENQYLAPMPRTEPNVVDALGRRLARAIRDGEDFRVVVVTNHDHFNAMPAPRFTLGVNLYRALAHIENVVARSGASTEQLREHLVVASLQRDEIPIFVHSKIFIQDDERVVLSTANLIDRSQSLAASDRELGIVIDDAATVADLKQRLVAKHMGEAVVDRPRSPDEIFALARASEGHFRKIPPASGGLWRTLWFRAVTTAAPSLR
ncbi:MAG: phospholipase D-like domain-containing protein [Planctomycetota bacterium]